MKLTILYFASLRETLGLNQSEETLDAPEQVRTVGDLRAHLAARGGVWQAMLTTRNLKSAVAQAMARDTTALTDGAEVAFFPPVTGG